MTTGDVRAVPEGLWTVRDVAKYLRMSVSWVRQRSADGSLPSIRVGGWSRRFVPGEVRRWVESPAAAGLPMRVAQQP